MQSPRPTPNPTESAWGTEAEEQPWGSGPVSHHFTVFLFYSSVISYQRLSLKSTKYLFFVNI